MSNRLLSIITQLPLSSGELQEIEYFASTVFTVMTLYHVVTIFSTILLLSFAICSRSRSGPDNDHAPLPYQIWGGYREKNAIVPGSDISPNYCGAGILPALLSHIRHISKLLWSRHLACAPLPYQIWGGYREKDASRQD
jgi:hypothetical protein